MRVALLVYGEGSSPSKSFDASFEALPRLHDYISVREGPFDSPKSFVLYKVASITHFVDRNQEFSNANVELDLRKV